MTEKEYPMDDQTDMKVFECSACGARLRQYQHFCDNCGTFSRESFDADDRPPVCEFFEDDRMCGEDSEWIVFRVGDMKPVCDAHLQKIRRNYRGNIQFLPVDHEGEAHACDCCGQGYGTHDEARDCCAPGENTIHIVEKEGDKQVICGLRTADVAWQTMEEFSNFEQSDQFDPNPFCHTCIGENRS